MPSSLLFRLSKCSPPAWNQTPMDLTWCCLTSCYALLSRSDRATEKVFKLLYTTLTHKYTHFNTGGVGSGTHHHHHKRKAPMTFRKQNKKRRKNCGLLFWLVGQMPQQWVKKENMQRLPCRFLLTGWREKESPQQFCRSRHHVESSGGGKRCPTHTHTPANLRLRGSVVVAVVLLLQLRANTHTLKHRRADSSRPLER